MKNIISIILSASCMLTSMVESKPRLVEEYITAVKSAKKAGLDLNMVKELKVAWAKKMFEAAKGGGLDINNKSTLLAAAAASYASVKNYEHAYNCYTEISKLELGGASRIDSLTMAANMLRYVYLFGGKKAEDLERAREAYAVAIQSYGGDEKLIRGNLGLYGDLILTYSNFVSAENVASHIDSQLDFIELCIKLAEGGLTHSVLNPAYVMNVTSEVLGKHGDKQQMDRYCDDLISKYILLSNRGRTSPSFLVQRALRSNAKANPLADHYELSVGTRNSLEDRIGKDPYYYWLEQDHLKTLFMRKQYQQSLTEGIKLLKSIRNHKINRDIYSIPTINIQSFSALTQQVASIVVGSFSKLAPKEDVRRLKKELERDYAVKFN